MLRQLWFVVLVHLFGWKSFSEAEQACPSDIILGPQFSDVSPVSEVSITTTNAQLTLIQSISLVYVNHTAGVISFTFNSGDYNARYPTAFAIEMVVGSISLDFQEIDKIDNPSPPTLSTNINSRLYTFHNLESATTYTCRIIPYFSSDFGFPSLPFSFTTLIAPINYWESIVPRRLSKETYGRGFGNPENTKPILNEGVEIFRRQTHYHPLWYTDAPTDTTQIFPSGRRGHSWTLIDGKVFMFGGRTNGK
jgi:hypothetical protein